MCIAKGVVAPFFKWILGTIRGYPEYDEPELDFWLACFNSWFIVCKILHVVYLFTTNAINMRSNCAV